MRKRVLIVLAVVAIVAIAAGIALYANREPRYHGRLLRDWIREGFDERHPNPAGAREAVMACGTNAIPYYLRLLQTKFRPNVKDKILDFLDRHDWPSFGLTHGDDTLPNEDIGAEGLEILGVEARPAVPALLRLVESGDEDQAVRAGKALACTEDGAKVISKLLSDPAARAQARARAATIAGNFATQRRSPLTPQSRAEIENSARILVAALVPHLGDFDGQRTRAAASLDQFFRMPDIVLPFVISEIANTNGNWSERSECAQFIRRYGPKAKAAVPALFSAIDDPANWVRRTATMALKEIDVTTTPEVIRRLVKLVLDVNVTPKERVELIKDLGMYGDEATAATPALIELTRSDSHEFNEPAAVALAVIDPETATKAGVDIAALFDGRDLPGWTYEIGIIRRWGDQEKPAEISIKCLVLAVKSKSPEIRREAGIALKKIAPEEAAKLGIQ